MKVSLYSLILCLIFCSCEVEEPIPTYTLTTTSSPAEGGKITISPQTPNHPEGSQVTLTPEPNENWVFKQWEGDATGSTTPLQITMTSTKAITGVFVKRDYPLTIKIEGEGTVEEKIITNPSGREYPHGTTVELTPKPKGGWEFAGWDGDLDGKDSPKRIVVNGKKNVTATFKESLMSKKLEKTVWVGDENYRGCDCGFSAIVGFKGGQIYELSDGPSKVPTGCLPHNFWVRDYNGEIKNYKDEESKISFTIVSGTWIFLTEIEIVVGKLKITTTWSNGYKIIQEYNPSTIKIEDYCK
jgi:hypothetical protein